jgi:hypothetical protein
VAAVDALSTIVDYLALGQGLGVHAASGKELLPRVLLLVSTSRGAILRGRRPFGTADDELREDHGERLAALL